MPGSADACSQRRSAAGCVRRGRGYSCLACLTSGPGRRTSFRVKFKYGKSLNHRGHRGHRGFSRLINCLPRRSLRPRRFNAFAELRNAEWQSLRAVAGNCDEAVITGVVHRPGVARRSLDSRSLKRRESTSKVFRMSLSTTMFTKHRLTQARVEFARWGVVRLGTSQVDVCVAGGRAP